jgi:DNA topoisomerase-2
MSKASKAIAKASAKATADDKISKKYQKLDHREHVLHRPNMYIGNIDQDTCSSWVFDDASNKMVKKTLTYIPGLYKIFDEILVNAIDHGVRLKSLKEEGINYLKNIKVSIDKTTGYIEIFNDGDGIEIDKHPEHHVYIPELIFGHLLTSANYDDKQERIIGGVNGIGSKACNIFSKHFTIETVDAKKKKLYKQEFFDNMSRKSEPVIKSYTKKPYTIIKFLPDFEKFKCTSLTDDMYDLMVKRTYDTCAVTDPEVNVFLNGKKLEYKTFEKYVDLYLGSKADHVRVYEKIDERWEVVASFNDDCGFEQVSFVNGIWTIRGGKHVEYMSNQLVKKLIDLAQKRKKEVSIKPQYLKDNLIIFIKSIIVNPNFDSQTKETLTTPYSKFGSKPELTDKFIERMYKSGIIEKALSIGSLLDNKNMKKTDGKKRNIIRGLVKLDDANWAGSTKSSQCTLILTEGDSSKTMAMAGIDEVGRDRYGVFPLKGKILNVKDCNIKKIIENEEITNLKKIIGLESDKVYKGVEDLRYGHIMIMTDQDTDGFHIRGLLFNLFQTMWPSLYKQNGFLMSMLTPIVKVKKGTQSIEFYNLTDYVNWKDAHQNGQGWHIKYYKGLGTSNSDEARHYFKDLKTIKYTYDEEESDASIDLAFNKKRADDRKEWLSKYDKENVLDYTEKEVKFQDFIGKELIHFSNYDVQRSIPSLCDGFKISQRKILFSCFKRDWSKECKVAQLSAYVSEHSSYHHGEESLNNCIVSMAQNYVGSNNINLLRPNGQMGSRIKGGKDSASPRYIYTELSAITNKIFRKEDAYILSYLDDDGMSIEPEYYMPIIPMILVNGAVGIGTGFSTSIPSYNPKELIKCIRGILKGTDPDCKLKPWFMGFQGSIIESEGKVYSKGVYEKVGPTKIKIKELPIGYWTEDFKEHLEHLLDTKSSYFKNYDSHYSDVKVEFILHFQSAAELDKLLVPADNGFTKFENEFKLVNSKMMSTTNMYLFNAKLQIQKYNTVKDIIQEFYNIRIVYYSKRKEYQLAKLTEDRKYLKARIDFINEVIAGTLNIYNQTKVAIEKQLLDKSYPKKDNSYDYLVGMPIYNLTAEKKLKLDEDLANLDKSLDDIGSKTCEQMWITDLDELEKAYDAFVKDYDTTLTKRMISGKK